MTSHASDYGHHLGLDTMCSYNNILYTSSHEIDCLLLPLLVNIPTYIHLNVSEIIAYNISPTTNIVKICTVDL